MKKYCELDIEHETNPWATHQPALIWAVENTTGPVLELGVGQHSTQLLHELLKNKKRNLLSLDDDKKWIEKFEHMGCDWHSFHFVNRSIVDWKKTIDNYSKINWGVVFVDQAHGEIWKAARTYSLNNLINCSDYVVVHDADLCPEMKQEKYECFEYIPDKKPIPNRNGPSTFIFSVKNKLKEVKIKQ